MKTIALYGGSFDPPHLAHVLVACWAASVDAIDEVWVVPTFQHAFGKRSAPFEERLAMCRLAFSHLRNVVVSDVEARLGGESRTIFTLEQLRKENPESTYRLVMGADLLEGTSRWLRWDEVAALAPPLVVGRRGYPLPEGCPLEMPEVSSSALRARLAAGQSIDGWVPQKVAAHIEAQKLYPRSQQ